MGDLIIFSSLLFFLQFTEQPRVVRGGREQVQGVSSSYHYQHRISHTEISSLALDNNKEYYQTKVKLHQPQDKKLSHIR